MPVSDLHAQVATIALEATAEHGFALGGGNALLAHGIITRPTQDVDLFTDHEHGVEAATGQVEAALHQAGFHTDRIDKTGGLGDLFGEDMGQGLAEWAVTAPSGEQMALQMAYFDRGHEPVIMEIGPVLDLEDAVGGKTAALASRAYERDYLDIAAAMDHYSPEQLISFARRLDPGLTGRDFADAGQRLDRMPDEAFEPFGLTPQGAATLREKFAAWPRDAEAVDAGLQASVSGEHPHAREHREEPARYPRRRAEGDRDEPELEP